MHQEKVDAQEKKNTVRHADLTSFQGTLPYASELFGVYQPLLGWKSRLTKRRNERLADTFRRELIAFITGKIYPDVRFTLRNQVPSFERFNIGALTPGQRSGVSAQVDSLVARSVLERIQTLGADPLDDGIWDRVLGQAALSETMEEVQNTILAAPGPVIPTPRLAIGGEDEAVGAPDVKELANRESVVAGTLHYLAQNKMFSALRIKLASNVEPRNSMELREEERIVVYRKLIGQLLNVGVNLENNKTRRIAAELISSMFDIDRMLYFVAPEFWRPRAHNAHQTFGTVAASGVATTTSKITKDNIVSWGGANERRLDNYYITEDSKPAKLGSSLGWLLQLDGDNMRNAFLNAPWVKAVVPIRPGKELAALNWLSHTSVEGTDGLDAKYQAATSAEAQSIAQTLKGHAWDDSADQQRYGEGFGPGDITIRDALKHLAVIIHDKNKKSNEVTQAQVGGEKKSYLPTDLVYENGFYPLKGGFKAHAGGPFEVFDQWVEILPTDQIVAVEVKYDPKTGMQI